MKEIRRGLFAEKLKWGFISVFALGLVVLAFLFIEHYMVTSANKTIVFSHESGFYDAPFDVEISVGKSYFLTYTLDGTDPTVSSTRYEGPIHIEDASNNENIISINKETSGKYFDDNTKYTIPSEKVDKCTLLRVCAFDYSGNKVSGALREYFVGFDEKKGYDGLYTVCVSTNPEYLFDDNIGIYTLGTPFRDFVDSGEADKFDWESNWVKQREANWYKGGYVWERVCSLEVFEPEGNQVIHTNCGMRIRGHDSRHLPQKSIGLYARGEYNNNDIDRFDYDFFNDGYGPSSIVIFNSGDDSDVKLIDYLIYELLQKGENEFPVSKLIPCNLFLNGEYWGPMYIMDDLNADYIATKYDVSKSNVRLLKSGVLKGSDEIAEISTDAEEWEELCAYIKEHDMRDKDNYDYVCSKIDMESFVDYAATELYIGNNNWHLDNNYACWRTAKIEHGNKYADGKWRFCLYDVNDSFRDDVPAERLFKKAIDFQPMVRSLGHNPEFERMFKSRIVELEEMFSEEKVNALIDEWSSFMEEPIECYYKRFADKTGVENEFYSEIEHTKAFLKNRPNDMPILYEELF